MAVEWTDEQVQRLCSLVHEIPASVSDVERWKVVSKQLGTHSKGECYRKYQELLRRANEPPPPTADAEAKPEVQHPAATTAAIRAPPLPLQPSRGLAVSAAEVRSRPPTPAESAFLTSVLSDGTRALPKSWTQQGICFRRDREFGWAVRQWEGGPCGPLAVIQAFLVRALQRAYGVRWREPSDEEKAQCLSSVLADMLLRCQTREDEAAIKICALPEQGTILGDNLSARQLFHSMTVREVPVRLARQFLTNQLAQQHRQYTAGRGPGLLLFLSSVLLSKGEDAVKADMVLSEHMIDRHGYASQELVNLLISGQATPCVFDQTPETAADAIATEQGRLCGIKSRCEVGFLTSLEFFEHVAVGEHLKRPTADVWVICMESHYTMVFAHAGFHENLDAKTSRDTFDVVYYDQLEKAAELIVLTLAKSDDNQRRLDPAQAPPLELVLHTRWPGYSVDWNGTEPLL